MVVLERMVERLMTDSPPSYPLFLFFSRIYVYAWSGYFFFFFFRADVESPKHPLIASFLRPFRYKTVFHNPPSLLLINLHISGENSTMTIVDWYCRHTVLRLKNPVWLASGNISPGRGWALTLTPHKAPPTPAFLSSSSPKWKGQRKTPPFIPSHHSMSGW